MRKFNLSKIASIMLALLFAFGVFEPLSLSTPAVTAYATSGDSKEARDNEGQINVSEDIDFWNDINIDTSFAHQIRMATNYANRMAAQGVDIGGDVYSDEANLKMSNIGVFFGYTVGEIDTDKVTSPELTRGSRDSDSSITYSRDLFLSYKDNKASDYYNYGLLLSEIGFDSVGSSAPDSRRPVFGLIALLSYYGASSVNIMFETMFKILEATNPFQFFKDAALDVGQSEITNIVTKADAAIGSSKPAMNTLRKFISDIYKMFTEFAWAVAIPLALIFIIVAFFLTRNGRMSFGSNIKKFFIRTAFLVIGIPILGSAYTQVLDALKASQAMSDDFITQAVSYTFLDFGRWVEMRRLEPISSGVGQLQGTTSSDLSILAVNKRGSSSQDAVVGANTWFGLRNWCSKLNEANKVFTLDGKYLGIDKNTGALLKDFIYDTSIETPNLSIETSASQTSSTNWDNRESIKSVITKYMNGTKYSANAFQDGTIAYLKENVENYGDMLALSCNKYSFSQKSTRKVEGLQGQSQYYNPDEPENASEWQEVAKDRFSGFKGWTDYNIWNNGTIAVTGSNGGNGDFSLIKFGTSGSSGGSGDEKAGLDPTRKMGFSTMGMYTYLTTEFTQVGAIAYGGAPSVYTQNAHYAVNLIGGDYVMQFAFFANMIAVLAGYFLLAVFFVFRTAFEVVFKGFQLIGHALFAALGFYKSIGTAICMTINMIAELFVSVIFFSFMVDLMFIMSSVLNNISSDLFVKLGIPKNTIGSYSAESISDSFKAQVLVIVSSLLVTFAIVFFVSFAIKWRAAIMSSINSMIENIIGTLLGVQLSGASNGYMPGMAMSALNDTLNVAKTGAAIAGGTALVNEAMAMGKDIGESAINTFGGEDGEDGTDTANAGIVTGEKSAIDGAVAPTEGAAFDGGIGKTEGDAEVNKADAEDALANGVGNHSSGSFDSSSNESEKISLEKAENSEKLSNKATETDSVAESNAAADGSDGNDGTIAAASNNGVYIDENGKPILARNGKSENTNKNTNENTITNENAFAADPGDGDMSDEVGSSGVEIGIIGGGLGGSKHNDAGSGDDNVIEKAEKTKSDAASDTASGGTTETIEQTVSENTAATGEMVSNVESSVTEDEQGTLWSQTNPETGTETTARFDMQRGLVVGMTNEDGTVSDVAIGMNGISTSSVDADGNEQTVAFSKNGIQTTYEGADGTHETVDVDTANGTSTIYRTDANGNTEEIVTDANGTVSTKTETAADGSTRVVTTNSDGTQTIEETNATTGYEATETISADGTSVKTESLNGVTTVTNTNADGEMTAQTITKLDDNGNEIVTSNSVAEDGSVTSSVTANGVTTTTTTGVDGSRTETQSVVRADGTTVTTTTDYGTDTIADSVHTEVKSANGMETIQVSDTVTGSDDNGEYTSNIVKSAAGTTETRDYGNGHVITTETAASGATSVTETHGDGNYTVTETDAATGNTSVTSISGDGKGETVVRNANNDILSQAEIKPNENGSISYTNAAGGTIAMSTVGEGKERESVTVQSYVSGGQMAAAVNEKTGSWTTTATDGMGSETVTAYDAKSGATSVQFAHINGNHGSSILESNGSFRQEVATVDGGVSSIVREGSGENMTEVVTKIDAGGNGSVVTSKGGRIERVEAMTGGSASYVQEAGENGSIVTRQTLENGSVIVTTAQANGDYVQETTTANGAKSYVESTGGVVTQRDVSLTGIETVALREGSASRETVTYGGIKMSTIADGTPCQTTQTFTTSGGQTFTLEQGSDGVKNIVELGDGNYGSFKQNNDGSTVNIVRNAAGSRRVETTADGVSTVVYTDAAGNVVSAPQGADTFNDAFANGMAGFAGNVQNIAVPTYMGYRVNNIIDNVQSQQDDISSNLNLAGVTGNVATGTTPVYDTQSDLSVSVTHGSSSGIKKKSFFEKMYNRMINNEEAETAETTETTEITQETGTTTQRKLGATTTASTLHRSDGKFGDYATRRGGSASQNDAQDNTNDNK